MGAKWSVEAKPVTDRDPIELAMREIQRTGTEAAGPNSSIVAAADRAREILEPTRQKPIEIEKPRLAKLASLPRDTAISLRWTLRDIDRKRTKFAPVNPGDLKLLMEMGLVEMMDDGALWLTSDGHREIG